MVQAGGHIAITEQLHVRHYTIILFSDPVFLPALVKAFDILSRNCTAETICFVSITHAHLENYHRAIRVTTPTKTSTIAQPGGVNTLLSASAVVDAVSNAVSEDMASVRFRFPYSLVSFDRLLAEQEHHVT